MEYEVFKEISEMTCEFAITLTINTHPRSHPKYVQDKIILKNIVNEAKKRLSEQYSSRQLVTILAQLDRIEKEVDLLHSQVGIVIFVSEDYLKIMILPFMPGNSIEISDKFYIRTLVRQLAQLENYYILAVSQGQVRLFEAKNGNILDEIVDGSFPFDNTIYYFSNRPQRSQSDSLDKNAQAFFRDVNRHLEHIYQSKPLPIILAGPVEALANYEQVVLAKKLIIGQVHGNFDTQLHNNEHQLGALTLPVIRDYKNKHYIEALDHIDIAAGEHLLDTDIISIYTMAINGQVREFVVENDYYFEGYVTKEGILSTTETKDSRYLDDAINEIIYQVMKHGGHVTFVPDYYLTGYRACAILRWQ